MSGGQLPKAAVRTLILLSLANALSYIHRVLPGALAPLLKAEFRLTDAELGLVTGIAFSLFYAVVGLPLARVADKGPRRALVAGSVAIWSAFTLLCGLVTGAWQFIVCRFAVGAAQSGATPAAYSMVTDTFPPAHRPMAFSMMISGTMVGLIVGIALGGWLGAEFGWRNAFLVMGAPGLLLAAATWLLVKEPARGASDAAPTTPVQSRTGFITLFKNTPFAWMCLSNAVGTFNIFVVSIWLPVFFQRTHDMPMSVVTVVFGVGFGGGLLAGTLIGGALGTATAKRDPLDLRLPIFSYLALPPIYWCLLWIENPWAALVLVIVAAVIYGLGNPIFSSATQTVVDPRDRSKAMATVILGNSIVGYGLGSYVIGLLSDAFAPTLGEASLRTALTLGQAFSIFGGLCLVMAAVSIRRRRAAGLLPPALIGAAA